MAYTEFSGKLDGDVAGYAEFNGKLDSANTVSIVDTGIDAIRSVVGAGESLVGIADLATGNLAGRGLAAIGYDPKETHKILASRYSDRRKEADQAVQDAKGFTGTVGALIDNPSSAFGTMVQSAAMSLTGAAAVRMVATKMLAGAGIEAGTAAAAEFLKRPEVAKRLLIAGGASEGAMTSGSIEEQSRQAGRDYTDSVLPALAGGAITGAIGYGSSKIPGFKDAEVAAATAGMGAKNSAGLIAAGKEIAKSAIKEGVLEELPQSAQEQVFTNLALGKPWSEGVGEAAAQGMVAGMGTGVGMTTYSEVANRMGKSPVPLTEMAAKESARQRTAVTGEEHAIIDAPNGKKAVVPASVLKDIQQPATEAQQAAQPIEQPNADLSTDDILGGGQGAPAQAVSAEDAAMLQGAQEQGVAQQEQVIAAPVDPVVQQQAAAFNAEVSAPISAAGTPISTEVNHAHAHPVYQEVDRILNQGAIDHHATLAAHAASITQSEAIYGAINPPADTGLAIDPTIAASTDAFEGQPNILLGNEGGFDTGNDRLAGQPAPGTEQADAGRAGADNAVSQNEGKQLTYTQGNVVEMPVADLALSKDVPQFKDGADGRGITQESRLDGKFDRRLAAPVQVWQRANGDHEVISGRHRLDLAQRSGEDTIPVQIHRESDGFTKEHAKFLDVELNVKDGRGKVKDYVAYFNTFGIAAEQAKAEGLLNTSVGRAAYTIGNDGTPSLIASHANDAITDQAAVAIAQNAPGNEALQNLGMKHVIDGKSINFSVNVMRAARAAGFEGGGQSGDLFGFDDSFAKEAEAVSREATKQQNAARQQLAAISGASKRPELAAKGGVNVSDPRATQAKIDALKQVVADLDGFATNPEIYRKLREDAGLAQTTPVAPAESTPETAQQEAEFNPDQNDMFGAPVEESRPSLELTGQTAEEIAADERVQTAQDAAAREDEAKVKAEQAKRDQNAVDAKVKARTDNADNFQFGESSKDAAKPEGDLFNQPESSVGKVELTGHEFGDELHGKGLREAASTYARNNFVGKSYKNISTGNKIEVTWQGIKHAVAGANDIELRAIHALPDILSSATFISSEKDHSGRADIIAAHKYQAELSVAGEKLTIGVVVREKSDGHKFYDQFVIKQKTPTGTSEAASHEEKLGVQPSVGADANVTQPAVESKPAEKITLMAVSNKPFPTERAAQSSIKQRKLDATVVPVEGGFGIKHAPEQAMQDDSQNNEAKKIEVLKAQASGKITGDQADAMKQLADAGEHVAVDDALNLSAPIDDFGEKISGAKKEYAAAYKDKMQAAKEADVLAQPLSKSWPEPDYQKLIDAGTDAHVVGLVRSLRDEIPNKPGKSYRQKTWASQVEQLRDAADKLLNDKAYAEKYQAELKKDGNQRLDDAIGGRAELYALLGHEKSLKGIRISRNEYGIYNGVVQNPHKIIWEVTRDAKATAFGNMPATLGYGATRQEAIDAFQKSYSQIDTAKEKSALTKFELYSDRKGKYFIGKKVGRNVIHVKDGFDAIREAREYLANNNEELTAILEKKKEVPNERYDINQPRIGQDMRNAQHVTPEMFSDAFGFRGVQFGNYVEGARRQKDLNDAYDALMDLAAVLGIPPKSLSLNGELGLAFGARGTGGIHPASAHYEPGQVVINLTKANGAGSLAHEWWHSLDNYFSRQSGKAADYTTDRLDVRLAAHDSEYHFKDDGIRKEMIDAFGAVMKAIQITAIKERSRSLDRRRAKAYWGTDTELSARSFERYVIAKLHDSGFANDYLANVVSEEYWNAADTLGIGEGGSYPYPTEAELPAIRSGFDQFFQAIESKETDNGVALFSKTGDPLADIRARYLAATKSGLSVDNESQANNPHSLSTLAAAIDGTMGDGFTKQLEATGKFKLITSDEVDGYLSKESSKKEALLELAALAHQSGNENKVVEIATVSDWETSQAKEKAGIDISGYAHTVDMFAVRHAFKKHGDEKSEASRGQIAIADEDIASIESVVTNPDSLIFGIKNKRGQDQVFSVKRMADGTLLVVEEVRTGKKSLALESIRKIPGAKNANQLLDSVLLNARGDTKNEPIIVSNEVNRQAEKFSKSSQTDAPEFKKWFGDSKVVDADGSPIIVYHGTMRDGFSVFDTSGKVGTKTEGTGAFFSDSKSVAESFSWTRRKARPVPDKIGRKYAGIYETYLSIQNPEYVDFKGKYWGDHVLDSGQNTTTDEIVRNARVSGKDGVIFRNIKDVGLEHSKSEYGDVYVVFDPAQIKSAVFNNGQFDAANTDIRYSKDGRILGFVKNGVTHLVADNISSTDDNVKGLLHHEIGVHALQLGRTTEEFQKIIGQLKKLKESGAVKVTEAYARVPSDTPAHLIDEEALGYYVEKNTSHSLVQRFIAFMRGMLRKTGFNMKFSENDIVGMAAKATRSAPKILGAAGRNEDAKFSRSGQQLATEAMQEAEIPDETWSEKKLRQFQDHQIRWKVTQDSILEQGGTIEDKSNVSLALKLFPGRVAAAFEAFQRNTVDPLLERVTNGKFHLADIEEYLYAMHAPERNAQIAKINDRFPDGGSGMTNAEAAKIILKYRQMENFAEFKALADDFRKITVDTQKMLVKYGVHSQAHADSYSHAYKQYVPLKGFEAIDPDGKLTGNGTGSGHSTNGKLDKRAKGRASRAGQILANIMRDHEAAIMAAEKANVGRVVRNFVEANPNDKMWTVEKIPQQDVVIKSARKIDDTTDTLDPAWGKNKVGEKVVKRDAQFDPEKEIQFIDGDNAVRIQFADSLLPQAYNKTGMDLPNEIFQYAANFNAFLRQVYTQKNPAFFLMNPLRDVQSMGAKLTSEVGIKTSAQAFKHWPAAWLAVMRYALQDKATTSHLTGKAEKAVFGDDMKEMAPWMNRYRKAGGSVGFAYIGDITVKQEKIENQLRRIGGVSVFEELGKMWQAGMLGDVATAKKHGVNMAQRATFKLLNNQIFDLIEHLNLAFENASRLATFRACAESGMSDAQSALQAKNVTTNFNDKGEQGSNVNALFLFANANIQGSANLATALTKAPHAKKAWAMVAGIAALGFMDGLGDGDDDDKIEPDYEAQRYWRIDLGEGKRFTIPKPYGWSFFYDLGRSMAHVMKNKNAIGDESVAVASSFLGNFSPVGNPIPSNKLDWRDAVAGVMPTIFKPAVQIAVNRTSFGSPLRPENSNKPNQPDSEKAFRKTRGGFYDDIAKGLNSATGGDVATSGLIDVSPEHLKLMATFLTGGSGRFLTDSYGTGGEVLSGDGVAWENAPIVRMFYRTTDVDDYRARFYQQADEVKTLQEKVSTYKKAGEQDKVRAIRQGEDGDLLRLKGQAKRSGDKVADMRDAEDAVRSNEALSASEKKAEIKAIEQKQIDRLKEFNAKYRNAKYGLADARR